jgi:hypothetical protein
MVVALAFGAGVTTDAFFVAYCIPNMLRRLLGEGALYDAMVPVVTEYAARGAPAEAARMMRAVLGATLAVLSVATVLGVVFAPWVVRVMAPGFARDPGQAALASLLTRVMFPYLALVGLGAFAMGALNAHGRFFAPAIAPAVQNVGMILCVLLLAGVNPPVLSLAIGVVLGEARQLACSFPTCPNRISGHSLPRDGAPGGEAMAGSSCVRDRAGRRPGQRVRHHAPGIAAGPGRHLVPVLRRPRDGVSAGHLRIALASAALRPWPARLRGRPPRPGDHPGLRPAHGDVRQRSRGPRPVPAADTITGAVRAGSVHGRDTAATAEALLWFAVGLPPSPGSHRGADILPCGSRQCGARRHRGRRGQHRGRGDLDAAFAYAGLAASTSLAAYVNLAGLVWPLGAVWVDRGTAIVGSLARTAAASVPLALVCEGRVVLASGAGIAVDVAWLTGTMAAATAAFVATAWWLGVQAHRSRVPVTEASLI